MAHYLMGRYHGKSIWVNGPAAAFSAPEIKKGHDSKSHQRSCFSDVIAGHQDP